MTWQPIETAPKDGRRIWLGDTKTNSMRLGEWIALADTKPEKTSPEPSQDILG